MTLQKTFAFAAVAAAFGGSLAVSAADWEMVGPGGGGAFIHPAFSFNGADVLCSSDMATVFRGEAPRFQMELLPSSAMGFCADAGFFFNPARAGEVYAGSVTRGLMRSLDGGKSWRRVELPSPFKEADYDGSWPPPYAGPVQVGFSSRNPKEIAVFYANYYRAGENAVWISRDGGERWAVKKILAPEVNSACGLAFYAEDELQLVRPSGVFRLDAAGNLTPVYSERGEISGFAAAGSRHYLAVNRDGAAWALTSDGKQYREVKLADHARISRLSTTAGKQPVVWFALESEGDAGVYRTSDDFKTIRQVLYRDAKSKKFNISNPQWTSTAWGVREPIQGLAVCPSDGDLAMATDATQAYLTRNGGRSWECLAAPVGSGGSQTVRSGGMPILSAYGYYFDPNNDRNRYIAMMDFCNWGSFDGGRTWAQYNTGNPFPHNVYTMLYDEKVPGRVWAGASQAHDLPCWKERANPKLGNAGLLTSRDGGRTWTALGPESGLPAGTVTGLVLDPESPPGRRTLFASLFGLGVFRSDDDGKTWRDSSNGIAPEHRRLFRLRRDSSGRLWTVSSMAMPAALYCSDDQGASWRKIFCDPAFPYLLDVVCDPSRKETFYLASFSTFPYHDTDGGIKRSTDDGKTWQTILPGVACWSVAVHPKSPDTLLACTYSRGLLISRDGGKSWRSVPGFPAPSPISVTFDPHDPDTVYVSCFGASVFRGTIGR